MAQNLDPHYALIARVLDPEARVRAEIAYPKPYLSRFCTGESARSVFAWSSELRVSAVHVMRLYLAPLALPFLRQPRADRPFCVLDIDDDDSRTYQSMMRLYSEMGDKRAAAAASAEAEKYRTLANRYFSVFDRVTVCSEADAGRLAACYRGAHLAVIPNGYRQIDLGHRHHPSTLGALRLLFIGSFGYFPNLDAAGFLCREVMPALRRLTDREIRVELVGAGSAAVLAHLAGHPGVTVHGFVADLAPLYAAADVAVVPVRAGGGTRIKILEAFAHGVPVVTTKLGMEGIDASDGEHLLAADGAETFARACLSLKERPSLATRLVQSASALLDAHYSSECVDAAVADVYAH